MVLRSALVFVGGRSQALQMCQPPRHPTPSYHQEAGTAPRPPPTSPLPFSEAAPKSHKRQGEGGNSSLHS